MKKLALCLTLLTAILFSAISFSYAADAVTEKPDIKININGQIGTYTDVPIIVNGRTLLPLRAVLTNLGVQNDDSHIIWNASLRSVTIYKDSTKIYLKIDDETAYINDVSATIDVAPIIYKNRTYIPARFISQSLGKKVAWDGTLGMVLLKDESDFNQVQDILGKSVDAMNSVNKYKLTQSAKLVVAANNQNFTFNTGVTIDVDNKKKIANIVLDRAQTEQNNTTDIKVEMCEANNATYIKDPSTGEWGKQEKSAEEFNKSFIYDDVTAGDINCSGLTIDSGSNENEILIKGKVSPDGFIKKYMNGEGIDQYMLGDASTEITIDKNTHLVKKMYVKVSGSTTSIPGGAQFSAEFTNIYSDYNGNFEVTTPQGVQ